MSRKVDQRRLSVRRTAAFGRFMRRTMAELSGGIKVRSPTAISLRPNPCHEGDMMFEFSLHHDQ
jgi:hypothetical protein